MDTSTCIEIVKLFYISGESATATMRAYKIKYGLRKDPFSLTTITRLITKFEKTGSVCRQKGQGRLSLQEERVDAVSKTVDLLQSSSSIRTSSVRNISHATEIPQAFVELCIINFI